MGIKSPFPSKILNDNHDNDNHDMHVWVCLFLNTVDSHSKTPANLSVYPHSMLTAAVKFRLPHLFLLANLLIKFNTFIKFPKCVNLFQYKTFFLHRSIR